MGPGPGPGPKYHNPHGGHSYDIDANAIEDKEPKVKPETVPEPPNIACLQLVDRMVITRSPLGERLLNSQYENLGFAPL